jgi:tetratricopeptide (TPR) repeat protein
MLTLLAYVRFAESRATRHYLLAVAAFMLGLMSKPMLVSLPLVMLLLDYWPLRRFGSGEGNAETFRKLLVEKLPFMLLSALSCLLTYGAQSSSAVTSLAVSPMPERINNALVSYAHYLVQMVWPTKLAVFYPYRPNLPGWQILGAVLLLTAITSWAFSQRLKRPYLLAGWLWYLITLIPVIGIVRVGMQSMADRYTYLPLIGIFIMLVWAAADYADQRRCRPALLAAFSLVILAGCSVMTWRQVTLWRDTSSLFTHALNVTEDNFVAHCLIGRQQEREGKLEEAKESFSHSIVIAPWYEYAWVHLGIILANEGRVDAAFYRYNEAIVQNFTSVTGHINLGILLAMQNRLEEAAYNFKIAIDLDRNSATAHYNLAKTLDATGQREEAIRHYRRALELDPYDKQCHNNLGVALAQAGKLEEAIGQFNAALRLEPTFSDARNNLVLALRKQKQPTPQPE